MKRNRLSLMTSSLIFLFGWLQPVYANHGLRQDISDLLGSLAWGMYLILPIPFLIIGTIGFLIYRAVRSQGADGAQSLQR